MFDSPYNMNKIARNTHIGLAVLMCDVWYVAMYVAIYVICSAIFNIFLQLNDGSTVIQNLQNIVL